MRDIEDFHNKQNVKTWFIELTTATHAFCQVAIVLLLHTDSYSDYAVIKDLQPLYWNSQLLN